MCVGDGALRYRDEIAAVVRCDFAEQFLSHPSAAPLVQLAHARALREEWVNPWEIQPLVPARTRRPDQLVDPNIGIARWTMSVLSRLLSRGNGDDQLVIEPMRRRHLADILEIEQVSYPKPWSRERVPERARTGSRSGDRHYIVARVGLQSSSATPGLMFVVGDAHVTNIAVAAERQRSGVATRLLAELAWEAINRGCEAMTLEVRVSNTGAQALYRRFGFVPGGRPPALLREHRGRDRHVVPRHRSEARSAQRLTSLSPESAPGSRQR